MQANTESGRNSEYYISLSNSPLEVHTLLFWTMEPYMVSGCFHSNAIMEYLKAFQLFAGSAVHAEVYTRV